VLGRLKFEDFVIRLNHRGALTALLEVAGVEAVKQGEALVALDKLDKVGLDGVRKELEMREIAPDVATRCLQMFASPLPDDTDEALATLRRFVAGHSDGVKAVDELAAILTLARGTAARRRVRIDPSLARGLSYYTGAIMEITVPDLPGSLGGGGRYDNLVGMFLGRDVPACGFSLGLERIIVVMTERNMFPAKVQRGAVDVMIACLDDRQRPDALTLASELRAERLRVEIYPETGRKLEKPLKYGSVRNAPVLVILGEDEQARGEVTVRDLQTRVQNALPRTGAAVEIARRVRIDR
jgi:histidyl-tRNA synthetase